MTHFINTSRRSPNHGERHGAAIRLLVLHATVGSLQSSLSWLCSPASRVSAHYVVSKTGLIFRLVPDEDVAWHAGASTWLGLNKDQIALCSVGVELENLTGMELPDGSRHGPDPYPPAQIEAATWLCKTLIARYGIERAMVVRHLDIAIPRGRKSDPAGFPWQSFVDRLYDVPHDPPPPPPPMPLSVYRVRSAATAGASIRSEPNKRHSPVGYLKPLQEWQGDLVPGENVTVAGFGSSNMWVQDAAGQCVWLGLLERVKK